MGEHTGIEWCDHTFSPWWGCTKVSPACASCYAEAWARRMKVGWGPKADRRFFGDRHWREPLRWGAAAARAGVRRRVFCASMADVFEARAVLAPQRLRLWQTVEATPHLDWLFLTKRPENILAMVPDGWREDGAPCNVWLGATMEGVKYVRQRGYPLLRAAHELRVRVAFASCEPLLEDVSGEVAALVAPPPADVAMARLGWVICGGESGARARPMRVEWARRLRDVCEAAGVPYFFKQWGEYLPRGQVPEFEAVEYHAGLDVRGPDDYARVGTKAAGKLLDGRTWTWVP